MNKNNLEKDVEYKFVNKEIQKQEMNKKPIVSIIIPAFNVEKYLRSCLDSVRQQSIDNIEIICVEDGSTDSTLDIISEYCNIDNRVRLINYGKNRGTAYARNRGLESATGKYVYFMDSDDLMIDNALAELVQMAESYQTDCIYFDSELRMETEGIGAPNLEFELQELEKQVMPGEKLFSILMARGKYTGSVCRHFLKRDYLIQNNLFFEEGFLAEDALFSFKVILCGKRMMLTNSKYHIYRRRGGSMSTNTSVAKTVSMFRIYVNILRFWMDKTFDECTNQAIEKRENQILTSARQLYYRNKAQISGKEFPESVERYLFEELILKTKQVGITVSAEILEKIKQNKRVFVYGAGNYAMDIVEALRNNNVEVWGHIVTTLHANSRGYGDIPVYEIGKVDLFSDKTVVILGVVAKNRDDVINTLHQYSFTNYLTLD